jgi:hypothetical protein
MDRNAHGEQTRSDGYQQQSEGDEREPEKSFHAEFSLLLIRAKFGYLRPDSFNFYPIACAPVQGSVN